MESLARDKHSSLLRTLVNTDVKFFITLDLGLPQELAPAGQHRVQAEGLTHLVPESLKHFHLVSDPGRGFYSRN